MLTGTAQSKNGNRRVILIGVERENISRLCGGRPIFASPDKDAIPEDVEVLIFFGETAADLQAQLAAAGMGQVQVIDRRNEGSKSS